VNDPPPATIGPYRILGEIGAGGMGTVYLGLHTEDDRQAAVKVLPAQMSREQGLVLRFNREIDALRKVESPHIVRLFESGVDDGVYFYAMEYVEGETLTQRLLREKRIPWRESIEIGVQICKALKSAHNAGIIHRDLKPSNLLLGKDGIVKLTDFGVAQVFAGAKLTVTGGVIGTAEYMSPEQARGHRATKQSDIYSLGAVLYVMLTGRPPFTGQSALEIAQKHRYGQFDSPRRFVEEIPHWLDAVVCQCLQKSPEDRYPDAYVVQLRLQEIPKKVELSSRDDTFEFSDADAKAVTQAATSSDAAPPVEVGGTIMRDLMKAEIERVHTPGGVFSVLDNVWVLVGLLALLILGGVLWHRSKHKSPEELFALGEELMQHPAGPAWEEARDEHFAPLLELDEAAWSERVEPYLIQVEAYEIERRLLSPASRVRPREPLTEPERVLQRALRARDEGDYDRAQQILESFIAVLEADGRQDDWPKIARQCLDNVLKRRADDLGEDYDRATAALARAAELREAGDIEAARTIWQSVLTLYDGDSAAEFLCREARQGLQESKSSENSDLIGQPNP